ncbi:MAG: glutathione S-transferase N-terminal domain-containing protein [Zoogloeaceae bacterium]|jgi:glutathione S-transferase|nr:glutathione S-transferase N-terminal domain-containing protein [Zoogloeaceae bacterium]
MKLIGSLSDPYTRKARIVLAEKKMESELVLPPEGDEAKAAAIEAGNPLGTLPVLVLDDGTPLFDSRLIVEYIDSVAPNNKLFPQSTRERAEVKRWEVASDGVIELGKALAAEKKRPARSRNATRLKHLREDLDHCLDALNQYLGEKAFCAGKALTMADFALGIALAWTNRFVPADPPVSRPNLERLYEKLQTRPSFQETDFV